MNTFKLQPFRLWLPLLIFALQPVYVFASDSLPQPLTLQAALRYADKADQYQLQLVEESLNSARAEADQTAAVNDLTVNLSGHLRKVGVSDLGDPDEDNDSKVSLYVRKPLYDFGKSSAAEQLVQLKVELSQLEKDYLIEQRELSITQKYFDVLNSDNDYLRNNENMAIGFIRFDHAREQQELGIVSELEVLQQQSDYEVIRQALYQSENMQRLTRVMLAEELGFPDQPPSELSVPELISSTAISDDVEAMVEQAYKHSLLMKIRYKELAIAIQQMNSATNTIGPRLDAELEVSDYAREGSTRDDWRASIYFEVPLYSGNREQSLVNISNVQHRQALAELQKTRSQIRITVLKLWQEIKQNSIRLAGELVNQDYRDMYLDKSRAEYELEFKTNLGDAMVQFSTSRMKGYQARFALEMAWRKLEKLLGKEFLETITVKQDAEVNNG
jgi:outer membrane protein TolC